MRTASWPGRARTWLLRGDFSGAVHRSSCPVSATSAYVLFEAVRFLLEYGRDGDSTALIIGCVSLAVAAGMAIYGAQVRARTRELRRHIEALLPMRERLQ